MDRRNTENAILGVACGDALGCPVQFNSRAEVREDPVIEMRGYGTFNLPEGSWTDDTSLTLALLESIQRLDRIDPDDIMNNFSRWMNHGEFTPYGFAYDIGFATRKAINRYDRDHDFRTCGCTGERDNGNGSLMRIMPACLFAIEKNMDHDTAVKMIDLVSGLTHNHPRAKTGCGLYYFMTEALLNETGTLKERLQKGLDEGFAYYRALNPPGEQETYAMLENLDRLAETDEDHISGSGYVVDALIAAVWCLITENSLEASLLKAVNLGDDTDTVAAIAGGLAGLHYGKESIPSQWLDCLKQKELIEGLCQGSFTR